MNHKKVLEKVYETGRLQAAWQQFKYNAGAAGIDRMRSNLFKRFHKTEHRIKIQSLIEERYTWPVCAVP
ncbi:MAG: hypothetical protein GAS50_08310 [Desulfobacterales bacterium]|nr:hypothetical protein [Desulfobacterales bacterium]